LDRPEQFKKINQNAPTIKLLKEFPNIKQKSLTECIALRRSLRAYSDITMTFEELSYLLWETSRVDYYQDNAVFRTIPTAGATNSMETYIFVNNVENINSGVYLYIQDKHEISLINEEKDLDLKINEALLKQLRGAQAVFFFTCVPARTEYKYDFCAHKMIAMEAGHACQNLSLSSEVIDSGVCAICAYDQKLIDSLLDLDGINHFTVYCATVGKKKMK